MNQKSHAINDYFREFSSLLSNISVTDREGMPIPFTQGVDRALEIIASLKSSAHKMMLIGNGGSAAIASHEALDFWRGCGIPALAFNDPVHLTCISNDFGYENVFMKPAQVFAQSGDLLIAISSSGRSKNILKGVQAAREKGCRVFTLSGFSETNPLRQLGDLNFYVASDAYGPVELSHLAILHALADILAAEKTGAKTT